MRTRGYISSVVLVLCSTLLLAQSCEISDRKHYSFQDIKHILDKNKCNTCHSVPSTSTKWTYRSYNDIIAESQCNQPIITPGYPNKSLLIDKVNGGPTSCGNAMPLGSPKISSRDLLALEAWIEVGAPEFCLSEYEQIKNIFLENKCNHCHNTQSEWSFDSYASMFTKPKESICVGPNIIKYDAKHSLLYQKIAGNALCGQNMPLEGNPLSYLDIAKVRDWINAGAPESAKALPVSLADFSIYLDKDESIILHWETVSEINTSHFEIEFSRNGIDFDKIGKLDATGNVQFGKEYLYKYKYANIGYHYFRLKIIDYDSKFSYSPIRVQKIENVTEIFNIMPNPILKNNILSVEWYPIDDREKVKLQLLSITGQIKHEFILNVGINTFDLTDILSGVYYLSIEDYYTKRNIKKLIILDI